MRQGTWALPQKTLRCRGRADRVVRPYKILSVNGPNWAYTAFLAMCHCEGALRPWQSVPRPPRPPLGKGAINLSDALHPSSYRISQCACWKNIFYQLSFIPNRIDCSFSFQRLSVWMTSSSVSVFGRICKMENWKNLYRSGCAQITSFISLLCPCSEST